MRLLERLERAGERDAAGGAAAARRARRLRPRAPPAGGRRPRARLARSRGQALADGDARCARTSRRRPDAPRPRWSNERACSRSPATESAPGRCSRPSSRASRSAASRSARCCWPRRRPSSRGATRAPPGPTWTPLLATPARRCRAAARAGPSAHAARRPRRRTRRARAQRRARRDVAAALHACSPRSTPTIRARQAQHLLAAGRREAARLNPQRAERYFERAIELDPEAEKQTLRAIGALNQQIGRPAEALAAFDAAREAGDSDAEVFVGMGVAQRRLAPEVGRSLPAASPGARARPRRRAARARGDLHREQPAEGRGGPARTRRRARAGTGGRRGVRWRWRCTRAETAAGARVADREGRSPRRTRPPASAPRQRSTARRGICRLARAELLRAVELAAARRRAALGSRRRARGAGRRRWRARGEARWRRCSTAHLPAADGTARDAKRTGFDELVASFAVQIRRARASVAWRCSACASPRPGGDACATGWSRACPTSPPSRPPLERDARRSTSRWRRPARPRARRCARHSIDLYAFESEGSLSASAIANVIAAVGTDAVFVARLVRDPAPVADPADVAPSCADPSHLELEVRMLSGGYTELPSILVDVECLAGGVGGARRLERAGLRRLRRARAAAALSRAARLGHDRGADQAPAAAPRASSASASAPGRRRCRTRSRRSGSASAPPGGSRAR